jgi:DNA-binding LytR/AlgR family response regulator
MEMKKKAAGDENIPARKHSISAKCGKHDKTCIPQNATAALQEAATTEKKKPLPPESAALMKKYKEIAAIVSYENYVVFRMADGHKNVVRMTFSVMMDNVRHDYFIQIQEFKLINICQMEDICPKKEPTWIELTSNERYNIAKDYRANVLYVLEQMKDYKRIRDARYTKRHKKKFSSKYDHCI